MTTERRKICNTPECRRMRALLSDFLDHTLHWRTARSLEVHLTVCPPCRVYLASVEKTILLYRTRPVVDVPAAVRGHLRALLRERHENSPKKRAQSCRAGAGSGVRAGAAPGKTEKPARNTTGKPARKGAGKTARKT